MPRQDDLNSRSAARQALVFWMTGALVLVTLLVLWQALTALLLAFAAVIFAVMLLSAAEPLERYLSMSRRWAMPLAGALILSLPVVAAVLIGPELQRQLEEVANVVPKAIDVIEQRLHVRIGEPVKAAPVAAGEPAPARNLLPDYLNLAQMILSQVRSAGGMLVSGIAGLIVVVVGGAYLASDPRRYKQGLVMLFPPERQAQVEDALDNCGRAIGLWLKAQLLSMIAVGCLSGAGAWAIGLPAPLAIGFLTGVLEFLPIVGPWLGAVPVLLLALGQGMQSLALATVMLLAVQQLESNVITPLLQQRMAEIPPFVVLFGIVAFGLIFGIVGILVAGPLTLVAYVLIKEIYVRDTLGQPVKIPGETKPEA